MEAHSGYRALETMRTYRGRVRASPLHVARLFRSWRLLFSDQRDLLSSHQESYIAKKIYNQLSSWGISADLTPPKRDVEGRDVEGDARYLQPAEHVIRCWLDHNCALTMSRALLDQSYVGRAMRVATASLPFEVNLPRGAKHDQRRAWSSLAERHGVDELLLVAPEQPKEVLEAHNSNVWLMTCREDVTATLAHHLQRGSGRPLTGTRWETPPSDGRCLAGITRQLMCELLARAGAEVIDHRSVIHPLHEEQTPLSSPRFYYLSSTLKSLSPIREVDHARIPRPPFDQALCSWIDIQLSLT